MRSSAVPLGDATGSDAARYHLEREVFSPDDNIRCSGTYQAVAGRGIQLHGCASCKTYTFHDEGGFVERDLSQLQLLQCYEEFEEFLHSSDSEDSLEVLECCPKEQNSSSFFKRRSGLRGDRCIEAYPSYSR